MLGLFANAEDRARLMEVGGSGEVGGGCVVEPAAMAFRWELLPVGSLPVLPGNPVDAVVTSGVWSDSDASKK